VQVSVHVHDRTGGKRQGIEREKNAAEEMSGLASFVIRP
jgi:hypothetical protein